MGAALLLEYYNEIPEPQGDDPKSWERRLRRALDKFKNKVKARYFESTLLRLLQSGDPRTRQATLMALGLTGHSKAVNAAVANMLHDEQRSVRRMAADALWSLWFRADSEANNAELQRLMEVRDPGKRRAALDSLISKAPEFAEAYNQRAVIHFEAEEWHKSIQDCEKVLKLNPYHFGAASGLGRCYLEIGKHRAALKAFRNALRINPALGDVEEAVRALETALGEEGRRDDKKS